MTTKEIIKFLYIVINNCLLFRGDDFDRTMGLALWMLVGAIVSCITIILLVL